MRISFLITIVLVVVLVSPVRADIVVYSNNFDGAVTCYSGASCSLSGITTTESVLTYSADGFSGNFLRNTSTGNPASSTVLTLTGLPTHTSIDINFLWAAIDSWDSSSGYSSPDWFNVKVDGVSVLKITSDNFYGDRTNYNGTELGTRYNRGFSSYLDRAFDIGPDGALSLAHTSGTLTISFFADGAGWQGGNDESWAIENLQVTVNPVPIPPTVWLLGSGLIGLVGLRRKLKTYPKK